MPGKSELFGVSAQTAQSQNFLRRVKMQKTWSYTNYEIKEGLRPGSSQFRYFFVVSDSGEKKYNYCVWIVDDALSRFDPSKDFNSIVSSQIETWHEWVKEKIDASDFRNRALKFEKTGKKEIDLSQMAEHVKMEAEKGTDL
jgi:hypothetical protein